MKLRDAVLVQLRAEINEDVAATNQVQPREGRIGRDILPRERAEVAHDSIDLVSSVALGKETSQTQGRHILFDSVGINTRARVLDGRFA
jgi:hypothetical protein